MGDVSTAAPTGPDGTTAADGYAPVPPGRRDSAGIAPHEETEPIFSDLSRQWPAAGRDGHVRAADRTVPLGSAYSSVSTALFAPFTLVMVPLLGSPPFWSDALIWSTAPNVSWWRHGNEEFPLRSA